MLMKDTEKIPITAMADVLNFLPDSIKEVARALLPIIANLMSVAPVLGPLPVILYKACVAVGQTFANKKGKHYICSVFY